MEVKAIVLDSGSKVISNTNVLYQTGFRKLISLWFKQHEANEINFNTNSPERPISNEGFKIDEDLVITSSWGQGFGIHRVNNDGTMTKIYQDVYPHASYAYYNSIAIDRINKIAAISTYAQNGITFYDYSGAMNGGDSVTKLITLVTTAGGLYGDECGISYTNGLGTAGDWFYYSTEDYRQTFVHRFKYNGGTPIFETITLQNLRSGHQRGAIYEDPANDRIFIHSYESYDMVVVTGASTASPKAFQIRYDSLPNIDASGYVHACIVDKDNPNHIWQGSGYQFFKMDITNCVVDGVTSGTLPTLLSRVIPRESGELMTFSNMRMSAPFGDSRYIMVQGDRGWNRRGGWVDTENFQVINIPKYDVATQNAGLDWLYQDYAVKPQLIQTAGGTKYWVVSGYGWDGYSWRTFSEETIGLMESGEITLGVFQLDNTNNIGKFQWIGLDEIIYQPSGTSVNILVSNNNGSTWEAYTAGTLHTFSSTGTQLRIKINLTGNGYMSGYILNNKDMVIVLQEKTDEGTQTIKPKHRLLGV